MALDLHASCSTRLREGLAGALRQLRYRNGRYLDFASTLPLRDLDRILPSQGSLRENLIKYISDTPFYDFVVGVLHRELFESGNYDADDSAKLLSELALYHDSDATAARLVDQFQSLPWRYVLSLELPEEMGAVFARNASRIDFCDGVRVAMASDDLVGRLPLATKTSQAGLADMLSGGMGGFLGRPSAWNKKTAYLQLDTEGFVRSFQGTAPVATAIDAVRSFLGLLLALRLVGKTHKYRWAPPRSQLIVHRHCDDGWCLDGTHELPEEVSLLLYDLEAKGSPDTRISEATWFAAVSPCLIVPFRARARGQRLMGAAQWLCDSYATRSHLIAFVQMMVALEIMLGDKLMSDALGVGSLLANRCAYLIGKGPEERKELLARFQRAYDVRSRIVHRGHNRLDSEEMEVSDWLEWICRRVLLAEIGRLQAELDAK